MAFNTPNFATTQYFQPTARFQINIISMEGSMLVCLDALIA
jgi:hypothetical protein